MRRPILPASARPAVAVLVAALITAAALLGSLVPRASAQPPTHLAPHPYLTAPAAPTPMAAHR